MTSSSRSLTDLTEAFLDGVQELLVRKNADYRSTDDALAGFNETAEVTGLSFEQVWGVFTYKHVRAIMNYVKNGGNLQDESIRSRLEDVAAYAAILAAKNDLHEMEDEAPAEPKSYAAPTQGHYWKWISSPDPAEKLLITYVREKRVWYRYVGGMMDGTNSDIRVDNFLDQAVPA